MEYLIIVKRFDIYNLTAKAQVVNMRDTLSVRFPTEQAYQQQGNLQQGGLQDEIICAFVYRTDVASCCYVIEILIHGVGKQIFFWVSTLITFGMRPP